MASPCRVCFEDKRRGVYDVARVKMKGYIFWMSPNCMAITMEWLRCGLFGPAILCTEGRSGGARRGDKKKNHGRVEYSSLDQLLLEKGFSKPDLIKVDIEGAEKVALQHAAYVFGEVRPSLLDFHNPECDHAAWDFSQRFGYDLTFLDTGEIAAKLEDVHGSLLCQPRGGPTS